ncbi:MAG: hypothetical protein AAF582_00205 [Pseudomonadota bacterium]
MTDDDWRVAEAKLNGEMDVVKVKMGHIEKSLEGIQTNISRLVWIVLGAILLRVLEFVITNDIPIIP